jgi:uncharacterized protein (TIGR02996 family)
MSDQIALLRALIDEPEELSHRLVYADWLEEHGDSERAEFIHGQCRLDPFWREDTPFLKGLSPYDLRPDLARKWLAPFVDLGIDLMCRPTRDADYPSRVRFRRGFVESIRVLHDDLDRFVTDVMPSIFTLTPLLHLHLACDHDSSRSLKASMLARLVSCPAVVRLQTLDLSHNGFGDEGAQALLGSPHLTPETRIHFQYNGLFEVQRLALESRFGLSIICEPAEDMPF